MQVFIRSTTKFIENNKLRIFTLLFVIFMTILLAKHAYAIDVLAGTDTDMKDTMNGTGKHWSYWIEGISALGAFMATKKVTVLFTVIAVSIFIDILIKLAGGTL